MISTRDARTAWMALLTAGALAGATACASPPRALGDARDAYQEARSDPLLQSMAPVDLYEAKQALNEAEETWEEEGDFDETAHLAILSQRRLDLARARAERNHADARIEALIRERDEIMMTARSRELEAAMSAAEQAGARQREQERRRVSELEEELARSLESAEARETDRGLVLTLGDVLFAFDKAELRSGAEQDLQRLTEFLSRHPDRELLIEGHTDDVGPQEYNLGLSQRRAEAVRRYLVQNGISADRLTVQGYGEAFPRTANDSPAGRQMNRRVDVVVLEPGESGAEVARRRARSIPAALPETERGQRPQEAAMPEGEGGSGGSGSGGGSSSGSSGSGDPGSGSGAGGEESGSDS